MGDGDRDEEKKSKFKVVDRRRFNSEGDVREDADLRPEPVEVAPVVAAAPAPAIASAPAPASVSDAAPPAPATTNAAPGAPGASDGEDENMEPPIPFSSFLQSLAQQTVMFLGMIPTPSGTRELQLEAARDTIDIIETLRIKTKGNLDDEEAKFLEGILYELRMSYMEIARRVQAAQAPTGRGPGRM